MSESAHDFRQAAAAGLANQPMRAAILRTTSRKIEARAIALQQLGRADELRQLASRIKQHTLDHLDQYLVQFIDRAEASGATLHFAATADDARRIVGQIAATRAARVCVKAKSMTTEEIHLNESLIAAGVRVVETDLGEFIVQLDNDRPSHIVTPIIHKDRKTIARIIARELGVEYTEDAEQLVAHARTYLREVFRTCDLGISGVNFAIAETGGICLCTNEGNGRLTSTRPRVHVAVMGVEKLIPRVADLLVFLKLLARSSTGQHMTVYTTLIHGPKQPADADGPKELHIVLLDAGRSSILAGEHRSVLRCIRCGACLNACPVYRQIGGHAYGGVYPGPIGKLLGPLLSENERFAELPRASSLCGLCREVCPVDIDIPGRLVALRREQVERHARGWQQCGAFRLAGWMLRAAWSYRLMQRAARLLLGSRGWSTDAPPPLHGVAKHRDIRTPAQKPFRQVWNEVLQDE